MVVISGAILNDLVGWIVFAIVLGMISTAGGHANHVGFAITMTLVFTVTMLTIGRWLVHKALPFLQTYTQWPGGVLGFALTLALLGAAFTEWIGIHAIFGAFLVGVAIGDSSHLREHTRVTIEHFVSFIFAPLFFASIGLRVDFLAHFDLPLVLTVLVIACACKLAGGYAGARWGGMSLREAWAVGFALNSRGAMEIILGMLALEAGIIRQRLFVALVIMALVSSMVSGPGIRWVLRPGRRHRLYDVLSVRHFIGELRGDSRRQVIREMALAAAEATGLGREEIEAAVWAREEALSTGLGHGVAIPHARLNGLQESLVVVGVSDAGVDFDAPDGKPANLIFLMLTPTNDPAAQLELVSEIGRLIRDPRLLERLLRTKDYAEFLGSFRGTLA